VEARLRPLLDPMKMNGCALVIANPPAGVDAPLREACEWVVSILGDAGGEARLWSL
jgi:23S rRNA (adenine2030-N6)-methyltransferase